MPTGILPFPSAGSLSCKLVEYWETAVETVVEISDAFREEAAVKCNSSGECFINGVLNAFM